MNTEYSYNLNGFLSIISAMKHIIMRRSVLGYLVFADI